MNRRIAMLAAVLAVSGATASRAQGQEAAASGRTMPGGSGSWSLYSGRTVGSGNALGVEMGWPGVNVSFLHASSSAMDLGARFTFNYGSEVGFVTAPATNFYFLLRFGLLERDLFRLALQTEPGLGFFFQGGGGMLIHFPVALQMSVHPVRSLAILLGLELRPQIVVSFWTGGGVFRTSGGAAFAMPMLFVNPGLEYALTETVSLDFRMAFGPGIVATGNGGGVGFSFRALMGASFKF
jgi:hypothetical protein